MARSWRRSRTATGPTGKLRASTRTVKVSWTAGTGLCGAATTYAVYRDTSSSFTPSEQNRLAVALTGTSWVDSASLSPATTYYYVVRATSSINGEEDTNLLRVPVTPSICTTSAPSPIVFFTARSGNTTNHLDWKNPVAGYGSTLIRFRTDTFPTGPADGTLLHAAAGTPGASDSLDHNGLSNGTTYYYAAFTDSGSGVYSSSRTTWGRPAVATGSVKWAYATGATSLAPVAVMPGVGYLAVSNDRTLHGVTPGAAGGAWPAGWSPNVTPAPAQDRATAVRLFSTTVGGASRISLVGAQDGRVYAFNAETGAQLWVSPVLGSAVQAAPSAMFTEFGGAHDLVFVGTRDAAAANAFYALKLSDGTIAWTFTNGGGANSLGIISGQAEVDYTSTRLIFTSRQRGGGSAHTVWCLSFNATSASKVWSTNVGDTDAAPVSRGSVVYVGNTNGEVYALARTDGTPLWGAPWSTGDGAVKGYVWPQAGTSRVYFSTTGQVHAINDDGGSASAYWSAPVAIASVSPVLVRSGRVYVGGGNSRAYSIDATAATPPAPNEVVLGDPAVSKIVGGPTVDVPNSLVLFGTDQGAIYAVSLPF